MRRVWPLLLSAAVGAAVALLVVSFWPRPANPAIPPAVQRSLDSLTTTAERDRSVRDSLTRAVAVREAIAASATERARGREAAARLARALADPLAGEAARIDSSAGVVVEAWRRAYDARTLEADSLRVALREQEAAADLFRQAALDLRAELGRTAERLAHSERVNRDLAAAVERAGRCRVLLGIPCPSRGQAFVGGLLVGGTLVVLAAR